MNINELIDLFKWMTVINVSILAVMTFLVISLKGVMIRIHGRLFGIGEMDLSLVLYKYLGNFKLLVIIFNVVPWLSLLIIR